MRVNGIKCDSCGTYFHFDAGYPANDFVFQLPDGWFTLYAKTPTRDEGKHFCSTECLHKQQAERIHQFEQLLQSYVDFVEYSQTTGDDKEAYATSLRATARALLGYEQE